MTPDHSICWVFIDTYFNLCKVDTYSVHPPDEGKTLKRETQSLHCFIYSDLLLIYLYALCNLFVCQCV